MSQFKIFAYAASNVGKRRQNNEDNYYLNAHFVNSERSISAYSEQNEPFLAAVCDGMGGEEAGELASQIACESIGECYSTLIENGMSDAAILSFVNMANGKICDEITKKKKRIGTTYTLLSVIGAEVTASNIGDSRIYYYSENTLRQISRDHTQAQSMVDSGLVSAEEAMKIPEKHRLTQHLGIFPYEMIIEPYTVKGKAKAGDRYLLCSDGLTDMLSESEIERILAQKLPLRQTGEQLIDAALEKGGKDNVTILLCEIGKADAPIYPNETVISSHEKKEAEKAVFAQEEEIRQVPSVPASTTDSSNRISQEKAHHMHHQEDVGEYDDTVKSVESAKKSAKSSSKKGSVLIAILLSLVMLGVGFLAGILVQKNKNSAKASTTGQTVGKTTVSQETTTTAQATTATTTQATTKPTTKEASSATQASKTESTKSNKRTSEALA